MFSVQKLVAANTWYRFEGGSGECSLDYTVQTPVAVVDLVE